MITVQRVTEVAVRTHGIRGKSGRFFNAPLGRLPQRGRKSAATGV